MARYRSKRLVTKTGFEISEAYCRKCRQTKNATEFYAATDTFLDTNGLMSICSSCIDDIYNGYLQATKSIELSVQKTCQTLNIIYFTPAIEAAKRTAETAIAAGKEPARFFGRYKSKLKTTMAGGNRGDEMDMTYRWDENVQIVYQQIGEDDTPDFEALKKFWGTDSKDDIEFLEEEMSKYRMGYVLDSPAQETLVKELCHLILQIDKDRKQDKSVEPKLKAMFALMNSMGISPSMETAIGGGKAESLGVRIKDLEETSPAEWYKDKSIYFDVDNIEEYAEKYITSPIRSFITGNKEFEIGDESDSSDDDDSLYGEDVVE